ncbi:MAG: hypothetical protein EKK64_03050 [Neisseriaceae bacterium]|nr:MAG: hypothetical protein EKK64_03050 [Neisseriaceae bacterium]
MYCLRVISGNKLWRKNGRLHRGNDLPAKEYGNGTKEWRVNGERHRDNDLPAVVYADGEVLFFEYGVEYEILKYENGTKEYLIDNGYGEYYLHKINGPAVIYFNGDIEYWEYGERHRSDGPAVVIGNKQYWYEFGEFIKCIV